MEMATQHEQVFGERLARIEVGVAGINERLDRLNGTVGRHDEVIVRIQGKCAAHEAMSVSRSKESLSLDEWRAGVNDDLQSLRESRENMRGRASTALSILTFVGMVLTLILMLWQSNIAYQQAHRASEPVHQR